MIAACPGPRCSVSHATQGPGGQAHRSVPFSTCIRIARRNLESETLRDPIELHQWVIIELPPCGLRQNRHCRRHIGAVRGVHSRRLTSPASFAARSHAGNCDAAAFSSSIAVVNATSSDVVMGGVNSKSVPTARGLLGCETYFAGQRAPRASIRCESRAGLLMKAFA